MLHRKLGKHHMHSTLEAESFLFYPLLLNILTCSLSSSHPKHIFFYILVQNLYKTFSRQLATHPQRSQSAVHVRSREILES